MKGCLNLLFLAFVLGSAASERVTLKDTCDMLVEPSNNVRGMKHVAFPILGARDYVFDGGGREFVFENGVFPFVVRDCDHVTLRNFSMRNAHPGLVQFKIAAKDEKGFCIRLEGEYDYRVSDGDVDFKMADGTWNTGRLFSFHSLDRMLIRYVYSASGRGNKDALAANFMATTVREMERGLLRFDYRPDAHPKCESCAFDVGESVTFALGTSRECVAMFFENCRNVTVENVTLSRFVGMGLVAQLCSNVTVRAYSTKPYGADRVTTTADDMMFTNCEGDIHIEECLLQDSQDDGCNVHGNYHLVSAVNGNRISVKACHVEQRGFFPYRPDDPLDFIRTNDCAVVCSAKVMRFVSRDTDGTWGEVELDRTLPQEAMGTLVENVALSPNVTLRNNTFVNVPHVRLSGRGKIVVENNVFRRLTGGILATDLVDYWREYGRITDMKVVGNLFDEVPHPFRSGVNRWKYGDSSVPKVHGRLLFARNRFIGCRAEDVSINGFREVVRDDIVSNEEMKKLYEEVKTPHKVGVVLRPEPGEMIDNPCVYWTDDGWRMMYIVYDGKGYETHLAKSDDLLHWTKLGPILKRGMQGTWDCAQSDAGPALFSLKWGDDNRMGRYHCRYWATYIGGAKSGYETAPLSIGVATTKDNAAVTLWHRELTDPVLSPVDKDARAFEDYELFRSFVLRDSARTLGSEFVMYYNAKRQSDRGEAIGMAVSDDMKKWRRYGETAVLENGVPIPGERGIGIAADPMITKIGDLYVMFYFSAFYPKKDTPAHETFAASKDLVHWTKWTGAPLVEPSEDFDCNHAHKPWVIKHQGVVYHFYCAVGKEGRVIALATSQKSL